MENGGHTPDDHGQWNDSRYALLFKPGNHAVDVNVGYYTTVHGLGKRPSDTKFRSFQCENGSYNPNIGALNNFWRGAENFEVTSTREWNNHVTTLWAVSQAAPLRRVIVDGNLDLYQYNQGTYAGYSSGGFMADVTVNGGLYFGSQQQFLVRNSKAQDWHNGVWNMVFVGCENAPANHCGNKDGSPYTTISDAPLIAEKPYITTDGTKYFLQIPHLESNKAGTTNDYYNAQEVDFSDVYVASASDSAATINAKLD